MAAVLSHDIYGMPRCTSKSNVLNYLFQIGSSDEISRHCKTICKQQCIDYFRFSPEEIGMTEKDNRKLYEIIKCVFSHTIYNIY